MDAIPLSFSPADEFEVRVDNLAYGGAGVARLGGFVIFIPGLVPGDRARIRIRSRKPAYAQGELVELLESSHQRTHPACAHFGACGGCHWMHLPYETQLDHKQQQVVDCLKRIGSLEGYTLHPAVPSPEIFGYRNKMEFTFGHGPGGLFAGLHAAGDPAKLVAIEDCKIQRPGANGLLSWLVDRGRALGLRALSPDRSTGDLHRVTLRAGASERPYLLVIATREGAMPGLDRLAAAAMTERPEVGGVVRTIVRSDGREGGARVLSGRGLVTETVDGLHLTVTAGAFLQINTGQAIQLYRQVEAFARADGEAGVLDLYCGVGAITLLLARRARWAVGVEASAEAVRCAEDNARANRLANSRFVRGDVRSVLADLARGGPAGGRPSLGKDVGSGPLTVIVNPPRAGLQKDVTEMVGALRPRGIVYVSCHPGTLARDLARFRRQGYRTSDIAPFDMFPHSFHIETVARLEPVS